LWHRSERDSPFFFEHFGTNEPCCIRPAQWTLIVIENRVIM
jgi:hypothetical protein